MPAPHLILRCDAHPTFGVGHLIRSLALGEEMLSRGGRVTLLGDLGGIGWVEDLVTAAGLATIRPADTLPALVTQVWSLDADAVLLDGYHLDPETGAALRAVGIVTVAMVDAEFGAGQEADLYIDQNLGAVPRPHLPAGSSALAGIELALFRDSVLARRRTPPLQEHDPLRVLAVFGGTDPYEAALTVVPLLLATGHPVTITVIAARPESRARLAHLPQQHGQQVRVIDPVADLAGLAATCDVAVSASGSSVWELLCLGLPTAVVCVVDNQQPGYTETVAHGVVAPLGSLSDLRGEPRARASATDELTSLLTDPHRRAVLAGAGQLLVDGRGRARVADRILARLPPTSTA